MNLPKPEIDRETAMQLWISERSEYAKEQIILNNAGIVGTALKSLNLNVFDDDLFMAGLVGLVKAINGFDSKKGNQFSTYAVWAVRNEILTNFRKERVIEVFSLDETHDIGNGTEKPYVEMIADEHDFEEEAIANVQSEEIFKILNEKEKKIISLKIAGKTQRQIGEICNLTQAAVSRIIRKACEKYKKKFIEEMER